MTIARQIDAEAWGKLSNEDQALYEKQEDGENYKFIGVNPEKLKRAKQHEKEQGAKARQELSDLQKEIESLREQIESNAVSEPKPAEPTKDTTSPSLAEVEKLKKKLSEQKQEHLKTVADHQNALKNAELKRIIADTTSKAFPEEHAHVGRMILNDRMVADFQDGKAVIKYKGRDGEVDSTLDLDGLIEDLSTDDRFKRYTTAAGQASGTGGVDEMLNVNAGSSTFGNAGSITEALKDTSIEHLTPDQMEAVVNKFGKDEPLDNFMRR